MRPGTPSFAGVRLREAREARGLSGTALADLLGVSRQAVSAYETGGNTPSPKVLGLIVTRLGLPTHFFFRPRTGPETQAVVFFRSLSAATKATRLRAERRYLWLRDIVAYLGAFVEFPEPDYPQFGDFSDPSDICDDRIEETAEKARQFWNAPTGPISSAVSLLERAGTLVVRQELGTDNLDAFSQWEEEHGRPYVILGSEKGSAVRSRFDATHELGHLVLHRALSPKRFRDPAVFRLVEKQANQFASAFLLPERSFADDVHLPSLDAFLALKAKWKVSVQAMLMRAKTLNLFSQDTVQRLWRGLARRGWRRKEPLDDEMKPEQPQLLREAVRLVVETGAATLPTLELDLALHARDIQSVCGLPEECLSNASRNVRLKPN